MDLTVLCVYRTEEAQEEAFRIGATTLHYPDSIHNQAEWLHDHPRNVRAIDLAPVDPRWEDMPMWFSLCGFFRHVAQVEEIQIVSGLDWDSDWKFKGDQEFW